MVKAWDRLGVVVLVASSLAWGSSAVGAGAPRSPLADPPAAGEIPVLVRELGDRSYEARTYATRRLSAIGMPAYDRLREAARLPDGEVALRAKWILAQLDRILLANVHVQLAFSKPSIAWDEPVDLLVTLINRSEFPAKVPFEIRQASGSSSLSDARQVADMLDVGDLLTLRSVVGGDVQLRMDDTTGDAAVEAVLNNRLDGGPVQILRPGERATLTVRSFNRGWARYPLLDAGAFECTLAYVPAWDDALLRERRIGAVVSNAARVVVTRGAPKAVSRVGIELAITLRQEGADLVAELTNRRDQDAFVNLNFASEVPFATGRWVWELDGVRREVPVITSAGGLIEDFDASRFVRTGPGESVELARIRLADLGDALKALGASFAGDRWDVFFEYANRCDRRWQRRKGLALIGNRSAPPIFQRPLPRMIPTARHTSNTLTAPHVP